jgi:hypothetical protein
MMMHHNMPPQLRVWSALPWLPMACAAIVLAIAGPVALASDFGAEVVGCVPAPGQFVNNPSFNDPATVLGPPTGGGTMTPDNSSLLSLGGFGGSVVIRFGQPVLDDPANYLGLDFIVFGNAAWVSNDRQRRWAEPATVEIMPDIDSNGLPGTAPGEIWYLLPGSLTSNGAIPRSQIWDDVPDATYPPALVSWFPNLGVFPYVPGGPCAIPIDGFGRYTTQAFEVPVDIYADPSGQGGTLGVVPNPNLFDADPTNDGWEGVWGYAEMSPTLRLGDLDGDNLIDDAGIPADMFYTVPDNPGRVGVTPGSGGGDAFDIAAAIDPVTGMPAGLTSFDFVRISTSVDLVLGPLGEVSPEIDAVADARPVPCPGDVNGDATVDLRDLLALRNRLDVEDPDSDFSIPGDLRQDGMHDLADLVRLRVERLGVSCD